MRLSEEIRQCATGRCPPPSDATLEAWYKWALALENDYTRGIAENVRLRAELIPPAHPDSPLQRAFEMCQCSLERVSVPHDCVHWRRRLSNGARTRVSPSGITIGRDVRLRCRDCGGNHYQKDCTEING